MEVKLIDTTLRDGSQSLWASWMATGAMVQVAPHLDKAGFEVVEIPSNAIYFKKRIRDLREDPWEMLRLMGKLMPLTPKSCMGGPPSTASSPRRPRSSSFSTPGWSARAR